ncbi:hypothetical protein Selin_1045 [Desulfurispirillum indicum S5]|uniref:Uncharacterized protein n=1 Tax=Desulfurispirillum indicum (strain ATCC BAA-1389 / DSM 22839 / S5) TaxID=653733 RepID=E6W3I7_DESIS|nr:CRISPR-associated endonuclease Cas2 [Desulfurispirillum indicum]ADU65780.1 hypothetical protein Selin_1045 [Desulfurispirillum indicum S5]
MDYIITCFVPEKKRRERLIRILQSFHIPTDHNIVTCNLTTLQAKQLRSALELVIEPDLDEIRIYTPCPYCEQQVITIGTGLSRMAKTQAP